MSPSSPSSNSLTETAEGVLIQVRVQPKASRDAVVCDPDGRIRIALTAPPVDGKANAALLNFLARRLELRKSQVSLQSGERSRQKAVLAQNVDLNWVIARLQGDASQ